MPRKCTIAQTTPAECFDGAAEKVLAANMDGNLAASGVHGIDVQASKGMRASVATVLSVVESCGQ